MYKIGEFANRVKSNIKTIRYYDEIDLLKPKVIDKFTSYRYYDENNVREYYSIILLKQMGFSLEEIKIYKNDLSDDIFLKQREKLLNNIIEMKNTIKMIDKTRSNIIDGKIKLDNFDYEISNINTRKKEIKKIWRKNYMKILEVLGKQKL